MAPAEANGQPMNLGVWYDFRNPVAWRIGWQQLYSETLEQASWAEELGFHSVWLSEHHFTDDGYMPSIPSALAAIAARTHRVRLGTAVILAPLHHPLRLAEDLAVVDLFSGGRLDIGLAAGYRRKEFDVMGVPRSERGQRTEETVQLLRLAWAGEAFSFHGKSYQFENVIVTPPPAQAGGPPLFLGGSTVPPARRAGWVAGLPLTPAGRSTCMRCTPGRSPRSPVVWLLRRSRPTGSSTSATIRTERGICSHPTCCTRTTCMPAGRGSLESRTPGPAT